MLQLVKHSGGLKKSVLSQNSGISVSRVIGGKYLMRNTDGPGALL